MKSMEILVAPNGTMRLIYDDALLALARTLGRMEVARASHVEPDGDGWTADMAPVKGPKLGPFETRAEALLVEAAWLIQQGIPVPEVRKCA